MRNRLRYALFLAFTSALLYLLSYKLVDKVFHHSAEILVNVKAFKTTQLTLFYNGEGQAFSPQQSDGTPLIASQFFKNVKFKVPAVKDCRFLKLDLGQPDNTVTIERITLLVRKMGWRDTLMIWGGKDIKSMVAATGELHFASDNPSFLHVVTEAGSPSVTFNNSIASVLDRYYQAHPYREFKTIFSAALIALFCSVGMLYFLRERLHRAKLSESLANGGLVTAGFFTIIFIVFFNNKLAVVSDMKNGENRTAAGEPQLDANNFFDYPDLFANFLRDNFPFRNYLFYANALAKVRFFHTSPLPRDVIVGKNGWFFYNEIGSIEDARKMARVPQMELELVASNMVGKRDWLAKRNIRFYVVVPPNKDRVYAECLPAGYNQLAGGKARIDVYRQYMVSHGGLELIDPTDSLIAAKKRREVYYRTDTHWNLYGGFKGYQTIMTAIVRDFPALRMMQEQDFIIAENETDQGDITQMISLQEVFKRKEYAMMLKDTSKHLIPPPNSDLLMRFHDNRTIDGSNLKLLMFRDSYANYLIPFLNMHFKDATYVWSYEFMDKLIEEEKPDVVIFESLQRFSGAAFMMPNPESLK